MKKVFYYYLFILIFLSCNSVKRVPETAFLLKENKIIIDSVKSKNSELTDYLIQKPNPTILGIPFSVYLYNLGNPNNSKSPSEWGKKNNKVYTIFKNIFSEKQSIGLANAFIGFNNWFLNNGDAPEIIDENKTQRTIENLQTYFMTQGYFKSEVWAKKDTLKKKKARITYFINKKEPLFLDTISRKISSKLLDSIYKEETKNTFLKSGEKYQDQNFRREAARILKLFRNKGIYNFTESYIAFEADTTRSDFKTNIELRIPEKYTTESNGVYKSSSFKISKINKVNVFTDYAYDKENDVFLDHMEYEGIQFFASKKNRYNPKYLSQSIFVRPNQVYQDTLRELTRSHLKGLKNFKSINIEYRPVANTNLLDANIYLTPIEKFTLGTELELTTSEIRKLGITGKQSIINRNTFKGAELLKLSFLGSFFNTSIDANTTSAFFNAWEIGADLSVEVPRFVAPFGANRLVPKSMLPKTLFSIGTSIQKNIGLDKQTIVGKIDYKWRFNNKKTINLELFNGQYIRNLNTNNYFLIYNSEYLKLQAIAENDFNTTLDQKNNDQILDFIATAKLDENFKNNNPTEYNKLVNVGNRYEIITSNYFIPEIAYSFLFSNQTNYKDKEYSSFRIRIANSGNFFALLSNKKNQLGIKTIDDIPIAQYFKTDIEYKKFWDYGQDKVIAFRSFLGVAIPYGNSNIPFTKSYFAGGSNDIRAWKTYELGPGATNEGLEFNIGNLKFLTSLEYRFNLFSNFKGALFIDAGNIWEAFNEGFDSPNATFEGLSSLKQIAIGSGFGVRYDFNFLVVRFDVGFKTYEPYLNANKWFTNYNFNKSVFNFGINYPF